MSRGVKRLCEYDAYNKTPLDYLREGIQVPEICEQLGLSKLKFFDLYKAAIITRIKELTAEGKTRKQIAKIMGISFDSVKKYKKMDEEEWIGPTNEQIATIKELSLAGINPKGISSELKIPIDWVYNVLKPDILLKFVQSNLDGVMKRFGMDVRTVTKIVQEEGFIIPNSSLALRIIQHYGKGEFPFYRPMSKNLINKVEGEIAGDAHIRKNRDTLNPTEKVSVKDYKKVNENIKIIKEAKSIEDIPKIKETFNKVVKGIENVQTTSFTMTKATKELGWNDYIGRCFAREGYKIHKKEYEDKNYLTIQSSVQLQELRDKWYKDGKKILPLDFKPNPTFLLHQYEGDGFFTRGRTRSGDTFRRVGLCTQNFTRHENYRLKNQLNNEIGINAIVSRIKRPVYLVNDASPERYYYLIYINKKADIPKFFEYIEKADKESLENAKEIVPHKFPNILDKIFGIVPPDYSNIIKPKNPIDMSKLKGGTFNHSAPFFS